MGFLGDFFGGKDKSTTTSSSTTTQGYNLPDWLKDAIDQSTQGGMSELDALRGTTANERFVDFAPEEQAAFSRVTQGTGQYDDIVGSALSTLQQAQQKAFEGVNPDDIQKFMNPYQQEVIDATQRELVRDADIQRNRIGEAAANVGAFGGSRHGIVEAENERNLLQSLSDVQNTGLRDAYDRAVTAARQSTTDSINAGGAIGNLTGQAQSIYNTDTQNLSSVGQTQRNLEQAKTDFTYTNPLETYYQQQAFQSGAAPLYGRTGTSNSTEQTAKPSSGWGSKLLGAGLAVGGMMTGNPAMTMGGAQMVAKKDGGKVPSTQELVDGGSVLSNFMDFDLPMVGASSPYSTTTVTNDSPVTQEIKEKLSPLEKYEGEDIDSKALEIAPIQAPFEGRRVSSGRDAQSILSQMANEDQIASGKIVTPDMIPTPTAREGMEIGKPEKGFWERLTDDEMNSPLVRAGLAMMASDKPFLEAIAEGGTAGMNERDRLKNTAANKALEEQKLAQQQAELDFEQKYKRERLQDYDEKMKLDALRTQAYMKDVNSRAGKLPAQQKQQVDVLKSRYKAISDLISQSVRENPELEVQRKAIEVQLNQLVGLTDGGDNKESVTIPSTTQDNEVKFESFYDDEDE